MNNKILVLDDEREIAEVIALYLRNEGYEVELAFTGREALRKVEAESPVLALLDVMLPDIDGFQILKKIREKYTFPVIMLTAKTEYMDKITGLTLGADDYIVKPFDNKELVARVKAVLRRTETKETNLKKLIFPGLIINQSNYSVNYHDKDIEMPPKELELLFFLASHPNQVFTREQLLNQIWGYEYYGDTRTVDVHIKRIREKLDNDDHNEPWGIKTVWGVGYKFEVK